jgi:hypothetical protein
MVLAGMMKKEMELASAEQSDGEPALQFCGTIPFRHCATGGSNSIFESGNSNIE